LHGFYNVEEILPLEFDLVQVQTPKKTYPGWWTGSDWFVRSKPKEEPVLAWRRGEQDEDFLYEERA
jgi:hypothetical protein